MNLPAPVSAVVAAYLEAVDTEAAGLVEALYLVGSVALGDFRLHTSDIDFVAVTSDRPDVSNMASLERVHAHLKAMHRRPFFDGIYVTWSDLACNPTQIDSGPSVHEGAFHTDSRSERNPITWRTLVQQGVCCRGPVPGGLALWDDPTGLSAWTNDNLDSYWRRLLNRSARLYTPSGLAGITAWACAWYVLGVSRLHYTLATGDIASKERGGLYALETFPHRWHRVIEEALRIRRAQSRSLYRTPLSRRGDVRAFTEMVIIDAHRLYEGTQPRLTALIR